MATKSYVKIIGDAQVMVKGVRSNVSRRSTKITTQQV